MFDPLNIATGVLTLYESKTLKNIFHNNLWDKFYYEFIHKDDYYFKSYTKHVTIYRNGNGIVKNNFFIRVVNDDSFSEFERKVDISDAKKSTFFIPLEDMLKVNLSDRFNGGFGFWYDCIGSTSHNFILGIDEQKQKNKRVLKWVFHFDQAVIKGLPHRIFNLSYAISIPGMFPIIDGKTDQTMLPQKDYEFGSSLQVWHRMSEINYIISFEKGIDLRDIRCYSLIEQKDGDRNESLKKKLLHIAYEKDIFYDKYILSYKRPKLKSTIQFSWNVK